MAPNKAGMGGRALAVALLASLGPSSALAAPQPRYCRPGQTDLAPKSLPSALAEAARRALKLSPTAPLAGIFYRCAGGRPRVCFVGANLPCGRGDARRNLPSANAYCRRHPAARFIPLVVTGHNSIYSWRCVGRRAQAGPPVERLDREGFIANYWKALGGK